MRIDQATLKRLAEQGIDPAEPKRRKRGNGKEPKPNGMAWLERFGLPVPEPEYRFHPDRKWRFDYAWPDKMIALEVEGGVWSKGRHTRPSGFIGDMEKYNAAAVLGWRVIRCQPQDIKNLGVVDVVKRILEGGG